MVAPKKNPLTKLGGKAAKAIQKKAAKEFGMSKPITKGKAKVEKRVATLNEIADYRTGGNYQYEYKKKMLGDVVQPVKDKPIKVKPRNLGKVTKEMAPSGKRAKRQEIRKYYGTPEQRTRTGRKTTPMPVKKNTTVKKRSK